MASTRGAPMRFAQSPSTRRVAARITRPSSRPLGEHDELRAPVARVLQAGDVAALLELIEEHCHRLLRDARPLAGVGACGARMPLEVGAGGAQIPEEGGGNTSTSLVFFGGDDTANDAEDVTSDTWTWDGVAWTQHRVAGPPAREAAVLAALDGKAVLFGGATPFNDLDDTWTWDGAVWQLELAAPPRGATRQ
jgi:hypothetical protein